MKTQWNGFKPLRVLAMLLPLIILGAAFSPVVALGQVDSACNGKLLHFTSASYRPGFNWPDVVLNSNVTGNQTAVTVAGIAAANKVYDGSTAAAVNYVGAYLVGLIPGDDVTLVTANATAAFAAKTVGADKTVAVSGLTLGGTKAGSYSLTQPVVTANITAQNLTVTGITAANKVFNGDTVASLNTGSASLVGVVSGDAVSLNTTTAAGAFADKNAAVGKAVTISGLIINGTDAANYVLTQPVATADITPLPLTVTATVDYKVYDRTTSSTAVPTASPSLVSGDTASWTQAFDNKNVGVNKTLTPAGSVNDGNGGNNYTVTLTPVSIGTINPAPLTVSGITVADKVYDGNAVAAVYTGSATLIGVLAGDSVSLDLTSAAGAFSDANTGSNKAVYISGLLLTGVDAGNYTLTQPTVYGNITALSDSGSGSGGSSVTTPTPTPTPTPTLTPTTTLSPGASLESSTPGALQVSIGGQTGSIAITGSGNVQGTAVFASPDKRITISILSGTVVLTGNAPPAQISVAPAAALPSPPVGENSIGVFYQCLPNGTTFNPPITLVLSYDSAKLPVGADESRLHVSLFNETTQKWEPVPGTEDTVNHLIQASISHFSVYAIFAPSAASAAPVSSFTPIPTVLVSVPVQIPLVSTARPSTPAAKAAPLNPWLIVGLVAAVLVILIVVLIIRKRRRDYFY